MGAFASPLEPCAVVEPRHHHGPKVKTTPFPEDGIDEPVVTGELSNPVLAREVQTLFNELTTPTKYIGVFAFLLLALIKRLRVYVWYVDEREDLVAKYAPWALESLRTEAPFEAIACRLDGHGGLHELEDARETNHWVACVKVDACQVDAAVAADAESQTFYAFYFSHNRVVLQTIADGDCAIDVMCLMIGAFRRLAARTAIRIELGDFLLRHAGNRSLIACAYTLREVSCHLGMIELAAAGAALLELDAAGHGDGDANIASHGDGAEPQAVQHFTDEEYRAVAWKCRLEKASPESMLSLLSGLPKWCIEQAVTEHKSGEVASRKREKNVKFLLRRDCRVVDRMAAAKHFLRWCCEQHGDPLKPVHFQSCKEGKIPYGWFSG